MICFHWLSFLAIPYVFLCVFAARRGNERLLVWSELNVFGICRMHIGMLVTASFPMRRIWNCVFLFLISILNFFYNIFILYHVDTFVTQALPFKEQNVRSRELIYTDRFWHGDWRTTGPIKSNRLPLWNWFINYYWWDFLIDISPENFAFQTDMKCVYSLSLHGRTSILSAKIRKWKVTMPSSSIKKSQ